MCWGFSASVAMVGAGTVAAAVTAKQGRPAAIPITIVYFSLMEALQAAGYLVVDQCTSALNQTIAILSVIHIIFQPFFINAFAMELVPESVRASARVAVYSACAASAVVMLLQLYPFDWAGTCRSGSCKPLPRCTRISCTVA